MMLWSEKYAPRRVAEIVGQKKACEEVLSYIESGVRGKGFLICGPSGSGKSTIIDSVAAEKGMSVVRLEANDKRSKEEVLGFISTVTTMDLFGRKKLIVVEDVDGMGAGDRGGVSALAELVKRSLHPVLLTAIDSYTPKLRPLVAVCKSVKLSRVNTLSIEKRLREICEAERVEVVGSVLKNLARWSNGDLRSAINDLEMACKGRKAVSDRELEVLGFRERGVSIYDCMNSVFKSGSFRAAKNTIENCDKDPEEIMLWTADNLSLEYSGKELARTYRLIAKADVLRARIIKQQNYRFKLYMSELVCGIGSVAGVKHGYTAFTSPRRMRALGSGRFERAKREAIAQGLGRAAHCSKKIAVRDYIPYLKQIYGKELENLIEDS